jgi:glycine/D-amino acid oxidase-like deaminating enzyme
MIVFEKYGQHQPLNCGDHRMFTLCLRDFERNPAARRSGRGDADPGAIERLHAICTDISPILASAPILAAQACFRPIARDGLPLIGRVPGLANAHVATGHSI